MEWALEFTVLGRPLRALGLSARLESWLRANWHFGHTAILSDRFGIDLVAHSHSPRNLDLASGTSDRAIIDGVTLAWQRLAPRVWFGRIGPNAVRLGISEERARIDVWYERPSDTSFELLAALQVALCESMRTVGLAPLHASVAARGGVAVAFTGRNGAGKSSTLVTLIARGWTPIAEDFAWLDLATRRVYGWDHGVEHAASATLNRIIELRRDPAHDSSVGVLDERGAVRALWESAGVPLCRQNRRRFTEAVPDLMRQLEIGTMTLGRTPIVL